MKQRRFIAWMLMVVSIVMLTASVLPHHHHREILCLQHDVAACECTSHYTGHHHEHHQHAGHCSHGTHHACGSDCVTHFQTLTPEKASVDVSPDYSFCALLYTLADLLSIPLPLKDTRANLSYFYLEKLHSTCLWHVQGLRAPPSFVLWWLFFICHPNVFVIQSEAKDLEYINVDAPGILRHYVPLNDTNA